MTIFRENLTDLRDLEAKMEIFLSVDSIVIVFWHGTVTFQRESMPPILFRDVLYNLGLKKNLISVSTLWDRILRCPSEG
jgi:hypothetical protein